MKKAFKSQLLYFLPFLVMIISCEKDESGFSSTSSATQKVKTIVTGRLVDESGSPVTGASVELEGVSTSTDMMGIFLFKNISVSKERGVIHFTKSGYIDQQYGFRPSAGKVTYTKPVMLGHESTQVINSSAGGSVSLTGGGTAQFPSNAFMNESGVMYSGSVTVKMTLLNP